LDRQIVYPQSLPQDTDILLTNRNALVGLGLLAQDVFGIGTVVGGLPCTPTAPASLAVLIGPGRIYSLQNIDGTAYGSLPADVSDQILKQGIQFGNVILPTPAPLTAGFSINYLIQAAFQESDTNAIVLPFFNAANPQGPAFQGQGNNGLPLPTKRQGVLVVQAKAGIAAATGTQTTPAVDVGFVALYVVTVANGQATVASGNIATAGGAPFLSEALSQKISQATADARYLRTGVLLLGGTQPAFNAERITSAQALPSGTVTDLIFNVSNFDQTGNFDTVKFTAPVAGLYFFTTQVGFQNNTGSTAFLNGSYFSKNNSTSGQGLRYDLSSGIASAGNINGGSNNQFMGGTAIIKLAANDTVRVKMDVGVGGALVHNITSKFQGYLLG
jgi:hypothetical protein